MKIKQIREAKHISQTNLAKKIGVEGGTLSRYEAGYISPSADVLIKIANALGVDIEMLFDENQKNFCSPNDQKIELIEIITKTPNSKIDELYRYVKKFHTK